MMLSHSQKNYVLKFLAIALCGGGIAHGQFVQTGTTPGGGKIIVGSGSLSPLSITTAPALSAGGFDNITLNPLSSLIPTGTTPILIGTSNNVVLSNGTIFGGPGVNPGDNGFIAIWFTANNALTNETVTNNLLIFGGDGAANGGGQAGDGGDGIALTPDGNLSNVIVTNNSIAQSQGGDGGAGVFGGSGGDGIVLGPDGDLTGVIVLNAGAAIGGDGGAGTDTGGIGGNGINITAIGSLNGLALTSSKLVFGGDGGGGGTGNNGGNGILVVTITGSMQNVVMVTGGNQFGGAGGSGTAGNGGNGGNAVLVQDSQSLTNFNETNTGMARAGAGGDGATTGGRGGAAYIIQVNGNINTMTFTNTSSGTFLGGAGGGGPSGAGSGGAGITVQSGSVISNFTMTSAGASLGGVGGLGGDSTGLTQAGFGGRGGEGVTITTSDIVAGVSVTNTGLFLGGNGGKGGTGGSTSAGSGDAGNGGTGGDGIVIGAVGNVGGITLVNGGASTGGAGGLGGDAGSGTGAPFGHGGRGGDGGRGIALETNSHAINGATVTNNGQATGGNAGTGGTDGANGGNHAGDGGTGGNGIAVIAGSGINGLTFTNNGGMTGGNGGNGGIAVATVGNGGGGADALLIESGGPLTGSLVINNGSALGGNGGTDDDGGDGIDIDTVTIYGLVVVNNGSVTGGNGGIGRDGGVGLNVEGDMANVLFINNGSVIGGNGGIGDASGNTGATFDPLNGNVNSLVIINNGLIASGNGTPGLGSGGNGAYGLEVSTRSGFLINNVAITNNGAIMGGNGAGGGLGAGGIGEDGVHISSATTLSNLMLINNGAITGGNAGIGQGSGGFGSTGGNGIYIWAHSTVTNVNVFNNGIITGGNGGVGTDHPDGGAGIGFFGGSPVSSSITNFGIIAGGNATGPGAAGNGVITDVGGLIINNWGVISAGSGLNPMAIRLPGVNNNVVNLNGHSAVNGLISASGITPDTNHLNLNFTGMGPAAQAALLAQLNAQHLLTGHDSAGTFTVRGVTYTYDPLVLGVNLSSYQLQGLTPNQAAVGASLDSALVNPAPGTPLFKLFNAIDQSGNIPGALEALSPQKYEIYGDLAIANSTATVHNVDTRLNNLRDGSESIDTTGIGGASDAPVTAGFSKDSSKESKQVVTVPEEKRWGFFATGEGLFFRANSHNVDLQQGKSNNAGILAGIDGKVGEHGVIGALVAYDNADATLGADSSHATIQSYTGGIYGAWHDNGYYVNSLAAYTRNHYTSTRNFVFPGFAGSANGTTDGNQATVNIDGGYDWHVTDRLTVGPTAGLQYVHLGVDSFNESGAGVGALSIGSQDMNSLQSRLGGRLNYHLRTSAATTFALDMHAAWQHEFLNDSRSIGAGFEGAGLAPFSVQTASPLRDAAVVGFGLNVTFRERITLFTDYELILWRASYFEQTINGGARISF